jgi:hypothetical protein
MCDRFKIIQYVGMHTWIQLFTQITFLHVSFYSSVTSNVTSLVWSYCMLYCLAMKIFSSYIFEVFFLVSLSKYSKVFMNILINGSMLSWKYVYQLWEEQNLSKNQLSHLAIEYLFSNFHSFISGKVCNCLGCILFLYQFFLIYRTCFMTVYTHMHMYRYCI